MLDLYNIEGSVNLDTHPCFDDSKTYPRFQEELEEFKKDIFEKPRGVFRCIL